MVWKKLCIPYQFTHSFNDSELIIIYYFDSSAISSEIMYLLGLFVSYSFFSFFLPSSCSPPFPVLYSRVFLGIYVWEGRLSTTGENSHVS